VIEYCQGLTRYGTIITDVPDIRGVVRDPNDDMIIACAVAAGADYIVTRVAVAR
jgi:predicted nucleic acid-binding protein